MSDATRMFPLQTEGRDYKLPQYTRIPWSVAEKAYAVYSARYGRSQSLERLAERGGFGNGEMDLFYPAWRDEVSELVALRAEVDRLTKLAESRWDCHAGPGTTEPACGACVSCLTRALADAEREKRDIDLIVGHAFDALRGAPVATFADCIPLVREAAALYQRATAASASESRLRGALAELLGARAAVIAWSFAGTSAADNAGYVRSCRRVKEAEAEARAALLPEGT